MFQGKSFLAIIPARGGSKRLPRKNILNLGGKPLIAWTIEAALQSRYIDRVVVSSDDEEILAIAKKYECEAVRRPDDLATDTSTSFDAVEHAIASMDKHDFTVLLQPTSPLRNVHHIDESIELLLGKYGESVASVTEVEHSPLWCNTLPSDGSMNAFLREEVINVRGQDLEKYYRLNGAVYICRTNALLLEKRFMLKRKSFAFKMEKEFSVDIDDAFDFEMASVLMSCNTIDNGDKSEN